MATIWRALASATLLLWGYVAWTGVGAGAGTEALAWHLRVGLVVALAAAAVQSLPFAYFLGTGFWVKAFVRASDAAGDWETRQKGWMQGPAYPALYLAPLLTLSVAVSGSLVETARVPAVVHPTLAALALLAQLAALLLVPAGMRKNSALMDELAEHHRIPSPGTPQMQALRERAEGAALPPLFQLSRVLLFFAAQTLFVWLYLRFGTERWRQTPLPPFALVGASLLALGLFLNGRYDPTRVRSPARAWVAALVAGALALAAVLALGQRLS